MFDNCSHDNCIRLSDDQILRTEEGKEEIALWLWEVHNAVNLRLMKEASERERREISKEEIVSSKFPSQQMCNACWLDMEQNSWDSSEIYSFLSTWYWPIDDSSTSSVARQMSSMEQNDNALSLSGFYLFILPLMYILYIFTKKCLSKERMDSKWKQNKSK
jgi:hypothetical protein